MYPIKSLLPDFGRFSVKTSSDTSFPLGKQCNRKAFLEKDISLEFILKFENL